jgi:dihydrofolate synthase/folylpolyglutamate synthase
VEKRVNYRDAIAWIIERSGYDKGFVANPFAGDDVAALGLKRTAALVERLGAPDARYQIAHVAGTKGKGSTSATIAAVARAAGRSTGLYATPHLHTFRERILINDEPISEDEFAACADLVAEADRAVQAEQPELGEPTAFEVATTLALLAFARENVNVAVMEVGMGGRLDATNVVLPDVSAITSISYDHTAILGDTLTKIAYEKGGIIKPGRPVVVGPQDPEAQRELERLAAERDAPLYRAGRDWQADAHQHGATLIGPWGEWRDVRLALAGTHQVENTGIALMALWLLDPALLADEDVVRDALARVRWPGRFERVATAPDIYVDGAHNVDSMRRLVETVQPLLQRPPIVILGISRDKDIDGMLGALAPLRPRLIATASHNPRASDPAGIVSAAASESLAADIADNLSTALELADSLAERDDVILVTGSLYVVAEAREALGLAETPAFERSLLYG